MKPPLLRPWPLTLSVLAVLLLALIGCEIAGWPFLRHPLERQLTAKLQRDVRLEGDFRLHLLGSIRLQVARLTIAPPAWERGPGDSPARPFVNATQARLVLPYASVLGQLRGNGDVFRIKLLEVGGIDARLVRLPDGRANWRFERPPKADAAQSSPTASPEFIHLIVHKGQLSLRDEVADLRLSAMVRTREGTARDAAGLFVRAHGNYRGQVFTAEARSPGILPLVAPRGKTAPVALGFNARLSDPRHRDSEFRFRGKARDLLRFEGLEGRYRVSGASLAAMGNAINVTLPSTSPFVMQGRIGKEGGRWQLDVSGFDVGDTRLSGRFRYDSDLPRPLLAGELRGSQLVLKDLAPAFGASPPPPGSAAEIPGNPRAGSRHILPRREFDIPSLHRMDAEVGIRLSRVDLGSDSLQPLQPFEGRLTLREGVLRLDKLLARTAQGELQGELEIDARGDMPAWTGDLRWSGIHLSDWIRVRNPFARDDGTAYENDNNSPGSDPRKGGKEPGAKATDSDRIQTPHFLTGELAGQARFQGKGRSTAAMLASLDGKLHLWIRDGSVSHLLIEAIGLDVAQGLGLVIKGDSNLPLRCAAMSMKAQEGLLRTEAGVVDTPDTLLLLSGRVSLAEETFGLRIEARPHDRSPLSVRTPLRLSGTFAAPRVRPELEKIGGKAILATVLGSLLTPLAALLPLLDPGESAKGAGCVQTLALLKRKPGTPAAMKRAIGDKQ